MGLSKILKPKEIYDGKRLFNQYFSDEWGRESTYKKLREWAKSGEGNMANPLTGDVSQMGPTWALWRYALENPEEAFPVYKKYHERYWMSELISRGISEVTMDLFLRDIQEHTSSRGNGAVSKTRYRAFCRKYNLDPDYRENMKVLSLAADD